MNKNLLARHETSAHNHMKFYKCFSVVALLLATSATLVAPKSSFASCKEAKPKDWTAGEGIKVTTPVPVPNPIVVCVNQSTTVSVSASDKDHWEIRCKEDNKLDDSGDAPDVLKYNWSGTGTFNNATSASTGWTAPATAGKYTLTCTIDDVPSAISAGETGSRKDSPLPHTVEVCVVDPGVAHPSIATVNYNEHIVAPAGNDWGQTSPTTQVALDVQAYFDCDSKTWKCTVTKAETDYNIFYRLIPGVAEASVDAANFKNYCKMISDLNALGNVPHPEWYMASAVKEHELAHVKEYKDIVNPSFAATKATIEALTTPYVCGSNAAQATASIKGQAAYTTAESKLNADILTAWNDPSYLDPNVNTDTAEHGVVDSVILDIQKKANEQHWPKCP